MLVHVEQIAGEKGRLVAPRPGADLEHDARAVRVLAADRQVKEFLPEFLTGRFQLRQFHLGQLTHFRVGTGDHFVRLGDLIVQIPEFAVAGRQLRDGAMLAHDVHEFRGVGEDFRIDH